MSHKRELRAQAESYMDKHIERLLEHIVPMIEDPEVSFSYHIEQIPGEEADSLRFESYLKQGSKITQTHEDPALFDIGLMFFEELEYTYQTEWNTLEFFFETDEEGDLLWKLHIDGERVHLC